MRGEAKFIVYLTLSPSVGNLQLCVNTRSCNSIPFLLYQRLQGNVVDRSFHTVSNRGSCLQYTPHLATAKNVCVSVKYFATETANEYLVVLTFMV